VIEYCIPLSVEHHLQYSGRALWVTQIAASPLRTLHLEDADMVVVDLIDDACMTMSE
jgi:hypothetical protein